MATDSLSCFKCLVTADGVMRQLDPAFDLFAAGDRPDLIPPHDGSNSQFMDLKGRFQGSDRLYGRRPPNCRRSST